MFLGGILVQKNVCTPTTNRYIIVPQNIKTGYAIAYVGDGIYTNGCEKSGVVQRNMISILESSYNDIAVVVKAPNKLISIRRLITKECW